MNKTLRSLVGVLLLIAGMQSPVSADHNVDKITELSLSYVDSRIVPGYEALHADSSRVLQVVEEECSTPEALDPKTPKPHNRNRV
ncbi:MAG: hypothetical protein AAF402_01980 [Pseudomonadota bacterium]